MRFPDVSQFVFVKKLLITLLNPVAIECYQVGGQNETDPRLSPAPLLYSHLLDANVLSDSLLITCALAALALFWMELHNNCAFSPHRFSMRCGVSLIIQHNCNTLLKTSSVHIYIYRGYQKACMLFVKGHLKPTTYTTEDRIFLT